MSREHILEGTSCWCHPDLIGDSVVSHRSDVEYAIYELTLIGDILSDYDGYKDVAGLMNLIDEVYVRSRRAVHNLTLEPADE